MLEFTLRKGGHRLLIDPLEVVAAREAEKRTIQGLTAIAVLHLPDRSFAVLDPDRDVLTRIREARSAQQ